MINKINSTNFNQVLIVDDVPENIQLLGNILRLKGLDISFAYNGIQAIELAIQQLPNLILLDIFMPDMDGYEVCRQLKANPTTKEIPIIFLTANQNLDGIVKGFELGAIDFVTKPFNSTELFARVSTHLELSKTKRIIEMQNELLFNQNLELKQLNNTKNKFFSIVARDLKNPINNLIGFSEMLTTSFKNMDQTKVQKIHQTLYQSSKQAYNVLDDLMLWSRLQTGDQILKPVQFSIKELIDNTVHILHSSAVNKEIHIEVESLFSHQLYADKDTIKILLRNLISNAIKFTQQKGEVTITTKETDSNLTFTITDSGVGIQEEALDKLFKLEGSHSTLGTDKESGTGLGLIICKEIVDRNKGYIMVDSKLGVGSTFTVILPKKVV